MTAVTCCFSPDLPSIAHFSRCSSSPKGQLLDPPLHQQTSDDSRSSPIQHTPLLIHHVSLHTPILKSLSQALRMSRHEATPPVPMPVATTTSQGIELSQILAVTPLLG